MLLRAHGNVQATLLVQAARPEAGDNGALPAWLQLKALHADPVKAQVVRAEAGVTMAALHDWLFARQRELSFSPEIGDATIGGLVTTMCKDSSVGGPGHLSALVVALTYVDDQGAVVRLSREADEAALEHYMCSYNTQVRAWSCSNTALCRVPGPQMPWLHGTAVLHRDVQPWQSPDRVSWPHPRPCMLLLHRVSRWTRRCAAARPRSSARASTRSWWAAAGGWCATGGGWRSRYSSCAPPATTCGR